MLADAEEQAAHGIGKLLKEYNKPIVVYSIPARIRSKTLEILKEYKISAYESIETTARCMVTLAEYGRYLKKLASRKSCKYLHM